MSTRKKLKRYQQDVLLGRNENARQTWNTSSNDRPWRQTQLCERRGGANVVDKETYRCARSINEAIWIRKIAPIMNRGDGGYRHSHVWDSLIAMPSGEQ